ncbi:baseplate J/gp47 family protein [Vibrio parahaemolyticus]
MFLLDRNQLKRPEVLTVMPFEDRLAKLKQTVLDSIRKTDPELAEELQKTFENEAELITKLLEAFTIILQNRDRAENEKACQMFGVFADESDMIDVIVSALGVVRQVLDPGDPNAFPPVPPTMESNDSVLTRYFLAVHALASTGTAKGYQFHAMTLDGKPVMEIESPEEGKIVVTYTYKEHPFSGQVKDARSVHVREGVVDVFVLSHQGDGVPSAELVNAVQAHLDRDEIGQETDLITVKPAGIERYQVRATVTISQGPDSVLTKEAAEEAVAKYATLQHRLAGSVEQTMLYHVLHSAGAKKVELHEPAKSIAAAESKAPYCEAIDITVVTE